MYKYDRYTKKTIGYIIFITHIQDYHTYVSFKDFQFPTPYSSKFFRTKIKIHLLAHDLRIY